MIQPPTIQNRADAPAAVSKALADTEERFGVRFSHSVYYPKDFFAEMYRSTPDVSALRIASEHHPELLRHFDVFAEVANDTDPSAERRQAYFAGLLAVYGLLDQKPDRFLADDRVAFVAPEREGRILAQRLGWLPPGRSFHPDMKRVPYEEGLLVGLTEIAADRTFDRVEIIDGAIASAATLMTVIESMAIQAKTFDVYSVHATVEGLRTLAAFARLKRVELNLHVGHATSGLSKKFYATDPADAGRVVVGDLGDTISDLA